jgi:hypothetical protein
MKKRTLIPVVAALLAAFTLTNQSFGQLVKNTNQSRKLGSVLVGGSGNLISSNVNTGFIGGGRSNAITSAGTNAVIAGGSGNTASTNFATIGGGRANTNNGYGSTIGGGEENTALDELSTVAGGFKNTAGSACDTVGGGQENTATNAFATVGGGYRNLASASFAAVVGGRDNLASGTGALAAGIEAKATNDGAFVWGNYATTNDTVSTNNFSWTVRAHGGVRFITTLVNSATVTNGAYGGPALTNGVYLAPNSGAWASLSDSNAKTGIKPIDARKILSKVVSMPVTEWKYKVDPNRRYIGPMAQDFHSAFGLGSDDKTISTLDSDGVTFAAIQGLVEELKDRDQQMADRDAEIGELKAKMEAMEERLNSLPPAR